MNESNSSKKNGLNNVSFYANMRNETLNLDNRTRELPTVQATHRIEAIVNGCQVSLIFADSSVPNVRSDITRMLVNTEAMRRKLQ